MFGYPFIYTHSLMIHSLTGIIHVSFAVIAMVAGGMVVALPKRGLMHRRIGYVYVISMLLTNGSAFLIYHLFGRFGPFHALAIFSTITIIGGFVPALFRKQVKNWLHWHYYFMNWSVVGLYAAFWAELTTRTLPMGRFWILVFIATAITTGIGSFFIRKHAKRLIGS